MLQPHLTSKVQVPSVSAVDEILYKGLPFSRIVSRDQLEQRFGKAASSEKKPVSNPHTGRSDTIYRLVFKGLIVDSYESSADHGGTVASVDLRENRWKFPAKLQVGTTVSGVLRLLGKPTQESGSQLTYLRSECVYEDKIVFTLSGRKVTAIKWEFVLD